MNKSENKGNKGEKTGFNTDLGMEKQEKNILTPEQKVAIENIIKYLYGGFLGKASETEQKTNLPEKIISFPEFQKIVREGITKCFSDGRVDAAFRIKKGFNIPENIINSPEIQKAAIKGIVNCLSIGEVDRALKTIKEFNVSKDSIINLPEIQKAAIKGIDRCLYDYIVRDDFKLKDAHEIMREFNIPNTSIMIMKKKTAGILNFLESLLRY